MDRRRAAGLLLALAACFAVATAAPTASNHTALDLYDGAPDGCYYNFQHYGEGDRIMTNEPCLNCTCHNRMLMCYLRVCPFTKPIGQDCTIEKRADQCCPIVTCPDVPVDLLTSTTTSPAEYGATGVGKLDSYGCSIDGKYFSEGSKVPPAPNKPCEHCYCIRNMTTCVMQECTLHVDGCTPIYHKDVCCPVRYSCDHPEDEQPLLDDMSTTVRPTPGFLLTTTTLSPVTQMSQDCVYDNRIFPDGALIKTEKACDHCYCMKGDIVCVVQECGTPMENEGKNCTAMPPREGVCCPDTYICEGDEQTTGTYEDNEITTEMPQDSFLTLSPPRRNGSEGSGYRNEDKAPFTETPLPEPEVEGSGEEVTESVNQFGSTDETEEPHEFISVTPETKKPDLTTTTQRSEIISTTEIVQEPEFGSGEEEKIVDDIPKESSTFEQPESTTLYDNFVEKTETTSIEPESHVKEPVTPDSTTEEDNKPSDEQEYTTGKLPLATVPDADENVEPAVVSTPALPISEEIEKKTTTALPISEEIEKKTTTALPISEEIERITTTALPISEEIETKTTTALPLSEEIETKTTTALPLSEEIEKKTSTALPMSEEIEKKTTTALPISEEIEKKTTTALPISEEIERKTTESDVNIMSTSADVEKESLQPEYHASSTTIASINDEEVSTDSDSITESVEGTDFAPQHQNVVTSSTPLLEEIEKETTELSEKKTTSFEDFNLSTTSTSRLPDENVDKQVETEIPEEFSTEHIPISGLETDLLPTVSPDNKVDDEDHVTDYEQYATTVKSPITDDKERRTTLSESTTNVPEHVDSDILRTTLSEESSISFTTAEPDKGLNTIPSGSLDEESSESSVTEKLHETAQTLTTLEPLITEKVYDHDVAETTPKSQQEITDDNTELSSDRPPQSPDQEKETTSDFTDKATTLAPSHGDIDSTTSIDKDMVTSEVPKSTEIIKETTETFDATTEISYISTKEPEKEVTSEMAETTTANLEENEILNESRIPGEGDCLVNGITYRNESTVPSSNKCETGCKCVSSILKCDPIICSAPPEYMDNCRTMYDSIDSCCPTYICDQKSETMPPQSHSQMSGTESPAISPVQCHGDECEIIEHKKETIQPCTSESCTNKDEGTQIIDSKPIVEPQDQAGVACNDENGCQGTPVQSCEGDACKSPEIISPEQDLPCHGNDCNIPIKPEEDNKESCHDKESCKPPLDAIEQECIGETCRRKEPSIPDQQTPECLGDNCDSRIPTIPETEQTTELASDITTAKISTDEFVTKTPLPEISSPSKSESEHDITTALPQESELLLTTNAPEIETSSTPSHVEKEDEMPHEESSTESKIPEPFEEQTISDENFTKMIEESTDIPKLSSFIPDIESDGVTKIFEEVTETSENSDIPKPIIENEQTPPQVSEYSTKVYETEMDSSTRKEDAMTEVSSETDKDSEIITISPVTDKILTEIPESTETYVGHDESSVTDGTPEVTSKKTHDVEHESTPIVDLEITTKPTKIYDAGTYESTIPTDLDDSKKVTPIEDSEDLRTTEAIEENLPTKKPEIGLPEASTDKTETDLDDESDIKLTTPEQSSHDQTLDLDTTKLPVSDTEETLTITTVTPEKDLIDDVTTKTSETTLKPLETTEKEMITDSTQKQIEDVTKAASDITTETSILDDEKVQDETKEDVDLRLTTLSFEYTKAQTESSDEIVKTTVTPIISDDVSNQRPAEEMTDTSVYNTETSVLEDNESSVTKLENVPESTEMAIEKETTVSFDHNDELTTKTVVEVSTQPTLDAGAEESHEHEPEQNLEMVTSADHMVTESEVKPESSTTSAVEVSPTVSEEENISEPSKTQEQEQDQETSTKGSEITDSVQPQTPVEENVLEPTKEHKDEPGTLIEESEVTDKSPPAIEVDQSTEPIKIEIETKPDIGEVIESVTKQSVEVETDSPKPSDIVPETDEKEELSTTASDEITAVTSDFRRTTPLEVHEYITTKPEVLVTESGEIGVTTKVNAIDETETKTTMEPIVEQSTKHDYEPEKDSHTPSEQVESESVPTKSYETEPEKGTTTAYETSTEIPLKIEQGEPEQPNTDATPSELPSSPKDAMITTESSVGYTSSIHTIDLGEATTLANDISELSTISEPSGTESPKIEPEIIVTESQEMQEISTKTPEKEVEIPLQATDMQPDISTSEKEEFVTEKSDLDKPDVTEKNIQEEGDKDITTKIPGLDTEVTYEKTREPEETSTDKITTDSSDSEVMKSTTPIIEEFVTDEPQKVDNDIREPEPELQPAEGTSSPVTEEIIETSTKTPESSPTENIEPSSEKPFITENLTEKPIQLTEPSVLQHEVTSESSDTTSHEEILEKETIQPSLETSTSKIYEHSAYPDEDHDVTNAPSTQAEEMSSTSQPIIDSHKLSPGAVEETFDKMSDSKTTTASPYIQTEKIEEVDHEVTHQDEHMTQAPDVKIPELTTVEDTVQSEITESSIISTTDTQKVAEETVTDAPGPITTSLPNVPETSTLSSEHTSPQQQDEIGTTQEQESEQTKPSDLESSEKPLVEMPTSEEEPSSVPDVTSHTEADSLDIETSTISRTEYQTSSPDIAAQTQAHDATRTTLADEVSPQEPSIVTEKTIVQEEPVAPEVTEQAPIITKEPSSSEASLPEDEILTTPKATTSRVEEEETTAPSTAKPVDRTTKPTDAPATEQPKPIPSDSVEDLPPPDEEAPFPPTGSSGYGQEPDYMEEDQTFGPGTCRYGGKVYVSAQQIPRDDPCDFCFCFRSDIICLQQSCPPPIHGCHEEPIQGFCCPRYECPVSMATTVNVTTTTTTTTTTLPPHFPIHSYKGSAQRKGCLIKGQSYKVGDVVRSSSGPCLHCTCGGDGQMKCDPKACTPEPMLRQMIAAAVSSKRRR